MIDAPSAVYPSFCFIRVLLLGGTVLTDRGSGVGCCGYGASHTMFPGLLEISTSGGYFLWVRKKIDPLLPDSGD